jgi:sphingomyelin phosphodiesterase acid-like 3
MRKASRYIFFGVLLSIYMTFGCSSRTNDPAPTNGSFPVLVFSDLHFNPFYDPALFTQNPTLCTTMDPSQWPGVFQSSKITTPSAWGTDTNYPLLVLALASIKQNLGASPLVLYTGDLIGHDFPQLFYKYCENNDTTQVAAMQAFTDRTVTFVASQIRAAVGNLPVMFAIGNIDSYTGYGPDSTFLSNNANTFYTQFLNGTESSSFLTTFTSGGYYSATPLGPSLLVIALNTNVMAVGVPGDNDDAVAAELAWLDATLASAQQAGQKVWLLMHVPPGANTVSTAQNMAGGQLVNPSMMMYQSYQESLLDELAKYPGLITMTLGAHTHMDEYRILSPSIVLDEIPAITTCFGENPAFKIFTLDQSTLAATDYLSLYYNLAATPAPQQFSSYYRFSTAYAMQGPLNDSLLQLYGELANNMPLTSTPANAWQAAYMAQYNSGNAAMNPNAKPAPAPWNPVSSTSWPVFACGIGKMSQADFEDCVNSY